MKYEIWRKNIKRSITDRNTRNGKEEGRERTLFTRLDGQMGDLTKLSKLKYQKKEKTIEDGKMLNIQKNRLCSKSTCLVLWKSILIQKIKL